MRTLLVDGPPQTGPAVSSDKAPPSIADLRKDGPATVDVSKLATTKILDKRFSPSGLEYKCELEPLWLTIDLVEKVSMGRVHARSYERGLVQAERLKTLRGRKRKFSQM